MVKKYKSKEGEEKAFQDFLSKPAGNVWLALNPTVQVLFDHIIQINIYILGFWAKSNPVLLWLLPM